VEYETSKPPESGKIATAAEPKWINYRLIPEAGYAAVKGKMEDVAELTDLFPLIWGTLRSPATPWATVWRA